MPENSLNIFNAKYIANIPPRDFLTHYFRLDLLIALRTIELKNVIKYEFNLLTFCYSKVYGRVVFRLLQVCERKATVAGFSPIYLTL